MDIETPILDGGQNPRRHKEPERHSNNEVDSTIAINLVGLLLRIPYGKLLNVSSQLDRGKF